MSLPTDWTVAAKNGGARPASGLIQRLGVLASWFTIYTECFEEVSAELDGDNWQETDEVICKSTRECGLARGARNPGTANLKGRRKHRIGLMGRSLLAWDFLFEAAGRHRGIGSETSSPKNIDSTERNKLSVSNMTQMEWPACAVGESLVAQGLTLDAR